MLIERSFDELAICGKPDRTKYERSKGCIDFTPYELQTEVETAKKRTTTGLSAKSLDHVLVRNAIINVEKCILIVHEEKLSESDDITILFIKSDFGHASAVPDHQLKAPSWSVYNSQVNVPESVTKSTANVVISLLITSSKGYYRCVCRFAAKHSQRT